MNLFEINETIKAVMAKYNDPDSQMDEDAFKDTLDSLEATRNDKLDGLAGWYDSNNSKINFIEDKIRALQEEKKRLTNQNKGIMDYMTSTIDEAGIKSVQTAHHLLRPRNYRDSVKVDPTVQLPKDYIKTEEIEKVNKKLLYQDLRAGIKIPGAELVPNRKTTIL
ncbi:siphovirus Gp157 family protein [Lactobacillus amylovorus]|uniref:siphovirus Gp157 family protein n=1 Tax=Lactobacillus amylovorus TaxID=1604 RepID=UPI00232E9767|nr:siphovirus Gp157 family protein [Lactobacillus amylovorus]MDB6265386.1 siphovirus Gp157 family protein [Lactobacillus amylovorus]